MYVHDDRMLSSDCSRLLYYGMEETVPDSPFQKSIIKGLESWRVFGRENKQAIWVKKPGTIIAGWRHFDLCYGAHTPLVAPKMQ